MIVAVAVKTADGRVWSAPKPKRHDAVFDMIAKEIGYSIARQREESREATDRWLAYVEGRTEGFLTDDGTFLDRREACRHARACGQIKVGTQGSVVKHPNHGEGTVIATNGNMVSVWFEGSLVSASVPVTELELAAEGICSEDLW